MLNRVEVRNRQGAVLVFPFQNIVSGFVIKDIQGLTPVKATMVSSSFADRDGEQYHSSRREKRNLIFKIDLEPDYITDDVSSLRNRLYDYFMPKSVVDLTFVSNVGDEYQISGRVESCEMAIFEQEPVVDVSILCYDPDFVSSENVVVAGASTAGTTEVEIDYLGTVETGIEFTLNVNRSLSEFAIYHKAPDETIRTLEFATPLVNGDVLTINTMPGKKAVVLNRGGTESPVLYGLSPQSNWIELVRGLNYIRVYAVGAAIPYNIEYTLRYGGL